MNEIKNLIQNNQTIFDALVQTLNSFNTATFNLSQFVSYASGKAVIDYVGLLKYPGAQKALKPFYFQYILPALPKAPSSRCIIKMYFYFQYVLSNNQTLSDALVEYIKQNVPSGDLTQYVTPNNTVNLFYLIKNQPKILYDFSVANDLSPISWSWNRS
jgi:hypothetical protein